MTMTSRFFASASVLSLAALLAGTACTSETRERVDEEMVEMQRSALVTPTNIAAAGAFSCDFGLPVTMLLDSVGTIIERDRMYMSARPGFLRKSIPFSVAPLNAGFHTGGRYLFATEQQAAEYATWVAQDFVLDGTPFFERSYFLSPACHVWSVVGAQDIGTFPNDQVFVRTERWSTPSADQRQTLQARFPAISSAAQSRGYSGVWLLYSQADALVEITYFKNRLIPANPLLPDAVTLATFTIAPTLGINFAALGYSKNFDRTQFVLTSWRPFVSGDQGAMSPWPNSPPLPGPSCGDAICSPSRGETAGTCAGDCPAHCGDATCQPNEGEDTSICPSDCRLD